MRPRWLVVVAVMVAACSGTGTPMATPSPTTITTTATATATDDGAPPVDTPPPDDDTVEPSPTPTGTPVPLTVVSHATDVSTEAFRDVVTEILTDPRGWQRAGFVFSFDDPGAPYRVVLGEADEVDELCLPMDTYGTYSCQNGPVVALNADRWRSAVDAWNGTLADYRRMLVNHEVGHLLHLHHPSPPCPALHLPAPVMAQQSSGAAPCTENPWPLQWEVDLAAEQREPLAPPASHDTRDHQPSPPPATE